ncbi:hypothetical protein Acr_23g0019170 [Actinidia rufa]|uniref:MORF/ORRM1/DAG-like MORF domain-containing protein n=1 Tax=Actinidia rufa TaxID=165716 RepID=A0A7J0GRW1_9ERIC|nr:hypothetical protein Acr_23g0019170 [Actinidia rufa]
MATTAAAAMARSILTVRSSPSFSYLFASKRLFSSITRSPPLPGFLRLARSTSVLSHSLQVVSAARVNPFRCRMDRSGRSSYSPLNSGSNFSDRPPTEMAPLFPGCDYEHWLIVMDKPGGEGATKQQMIDCYIQTLAKVVGSDEEAKKKIYNVSCERYFGFGCEIDEETSNKLEGLPGVLFVLPDSYVDAENKDYGVYMLPYELSVSAACTSALRNIEFLIQKGLPKDKGGWNQLPKDIKTGQGTMTGPVMSGVVTTCGDICRIMRSYILIVVYGLVIVAADNHRWVMSWTSSSLKQFGCYEGYELSFES